MKFVLIMTICSINSACVEPKIVNYYDTWKECAITGYNKSIEVLNELSDKTFEEQRSYTRFICREDKSI